jgi:hypothetical protein
MACGSVNAISPHDTVPVPTPNRAAKVGYSGTK